MGGRSSLSTDPATACDGQAGTERASPRTNPQAAAAAAAAARDDPPAISSIETEPRWNSRKSLWGEDEEEDGEKDDFRSPWQFLRQYRRGWEDGHHGRRTGEGLSYLTRI